MYGMSFSLVFVLVRVTMAVKRHHDRGNSYKENIYLRWLTYSFRASVNYSHDRKDSSMQAEVVLDLRVLQVDSKETGSQLTHWEVS